MVNKSPDWLIPGFLFAVNLVQKKKDITLITSDLNPQNNHLPKENQNWRVTFCLILE